jgi:hypothetical protein
VQQCIPLAGWPSAEREILVSPLSDRVSGGAGEPTEGGEMATLASLMLPTGATIVIPGIIVLIIIVVIVLWILF